MKLVFDWHVIRKLDSLLRATAKKFAFNRRLRAPMESWLPREEVDAIRRKLAMRKLRQIAISYARERGVELKKPYAWWESEAADAQRLGIQAPRYRLVLGDPKRTNGLFTDQDLVRYLDAEHYALRAISIARRTVDRAGNR